MLTQYQFLLRVPEGARPRPEWGYRLYASLLERVPADFGLHVHQDETTPVSQFVYLSQSGGLCWTVNLLGENSERILSPLLNTAEGFSLDNRHVYLTVQKAHAETISEAGALLEQAAHSGGMHTLSFRTAAAFRSRGRYLVLPTERLILQSLIKKWNGSIPECPIEDEDGEGMEALAEGLRFRGFRLRDGSYSLKGKRIPGFTGCVTLENRLSGFHRELADALLMFAGFAGIGVKTALGMGGVVYRAGFPGTDTDG